MLELAYSSDEWAEELWIMCKRDPLFYVNTFVWTFDPRLTPKSTKIPFITFDYQDEAILEIIDHILAGQDLLIEKSRDMGATWLILLAYKQLWTFYDMQSFRLVSRVEDLVDKTEDPDSLFWKLMFIIDNEPDFIMSEENYNKTHLHLFNKLNGSIIDGASTTGDVARGGRCGSMMLDEFASVPEGYDVLKATRDNTGCRIFNSTPKGAANAFHDVGHKTQIDKLRFHWSQDPRKNQGLYTTENGQFKLLDPYCRGHFKVGKTTHFYPDDYPFILDGKLRSPWYDHQCTRAAHPTEIAQELDIDYLGSDFQFFDGTHLARIERETVRPPYWQGDFDFDSQTLDFIGLTPNPKGKLQLWINPDVYDKMSEGLDAVLGIDISAGTGASNSVINISNRKTKEDIGEWACPHTPPEDLVKIAVALARYFNNAFMIWDSSGPGSSFGKKLISDTTYRNIYYRSDEAKITGKTSDKHGYAFTRDNKRDTLIELRAAMAHDEYVVRSAEFVNECRYYVHCISTNAVEHSGAKNSIDPTGARDNHGDRVIAKALAWKVIKARPREQKETEPEMPPNCFKARRVAYEQKQKAQKEW